MTKPLPFTKATIKRAVAAAREAGLRITAIDLATGGLIVEDRGAASGGSISKNAIRPSPAIRRRGVKIDLPYLVRDQDRHGNPRILVRMQIGGQRCKATIKAAEGTPEFAAEYAKAVERLRSGAPTSGGQVSHNDRPADDHPMWDDLEA